MSSPVAIGEQLARVDGLDVHAPPPASSGRTCVLCFSDIAAGNEHKGRNKKGDIIWACRSCVEAERATRLAVLDASWTYSTTGGLDNSGDPLTVFPDFPYARFENAEWCARVSPKLLNVFELYAADRPMLVLGATGDGKTSGLVARQNRELDKARAAVRAGAKRRLNFAYVTGFDLAGCRRRSRIGDEAPLLEYAARAALTFIDEVGFEPTSAESEFNTLLDLRHRRRVPTVVLSGLTPQAFAARYGGAVFRRLTQEGLLCNLHPAQKGQARVAG